MESNKDKSVNRADINSPRKPWQPMKVTHVGEAKDVVRGGGGKTSPSPNDPGDTRKPQGQG
jgi:hypothetical protein